MDGELQRLEIGLNLLLVVEDMVAVLKQAQAVREEGAEPVNQDIGRFVLQIGKASRPRAIWSSPLSM